MSLLTISNEYEEEVVFIITNNFDIYDHNHEDYKLVIVKISLGGVIKRILAYVSVSNMDKYPGFFTKAHNPNGISLIRCDVCNNTMTFNTNRKEDEKVIAILNEYTVQQFKEIRMCHTAEAYFNHVLKVSESSSYEDTKIYVRNNGSQISEDQKEIIQFRCEDCGRLSDPPSISKLCIV